MALKAVLQSLDGVPDSLRGEYKEQEGKFYLDIEGVDDHHSVGALRRAKDYEKEEARKAQGRARDLQTDLDKLTDDFNEARKNGIPKGDVEALENSYKEKFSKKEVELNGKITALSGQLHKVMIDGEAARIATDVAAKPEYIEAILPHIRGRLKLESSEDGTHVTRVLDKDGKPSAMNMEDLKKEVLGMKALAPLLSGSKANGGGAGGGGGGGAPSGKKLADMNDRERTELYRTDPTEFRRLKSEQDQAAA